MIKKCESLDDLIRGIKQLLLENRCSFSDEEKVLLNECIVTLQEFNMNNQFHLVVKVIEILTRLFVASEHLKDIL